MNIYLYGPPGSGKTTLGRHLAGALDLPFLDLDAAIEHSAKMRIDAIFAQSGEAGFRAIEQAELERAAAGPEQVVALGGGALLDPQARRLAENSGVVVLMQAEPSVLLRRVGNAAARPLLSGSPATRLNTLLQQRAAHYASFAMYVDSATDDMDALTWEVQRLIGAFRVRAMGAGYDARVQPNSLERLGQALAARNTRGPVVIVSDGNVAPLYLQAALESVRCGTVSVSEVVVPAGEAFKTIDTVQHLWQEFLRAGVERGSTIIALGGGVVGDLAGFAAATYLRGVAWVNVPTTLLAMVDSSLGGKTGVDLPQAKNLVGAFHPPSLVWSDPALLDTLPERELRGGMAEVIKHGVIADAELFQYCANSLDALQEHFGWIVPRAAAVKARVIVEDPYEKGTRQALNFGHTIGHGIELASGFTLSHGEAVAIGMVIETRLAEQQGIAESGLTGKIQAALQAVGLPVEVPAAIDRQAVIAAVGHDKKRAGGRVTFAVPVRIGEVRTGVMLTDWERQL